MDPFAPLPADDPRYVAPPEGGGERLARRLRRGLDPMLLVGHPGLGKSTELRRAGAALAEEGPTVVLDLADLTSEPTADRVLYDIARATFEWWVEEGPEGQPSPFLVQDLRASDPTFPQGQGRTLPPRDICLATLDELTLAADVDRLPLLLDGLDSLSPDEARRVLDALLALTGRAQLAVVAPPALTHGPANVAVLDRWRVVHAAPVDATTDEGRAFLAALARAHLATHLGDSDDDAPTDTAEVLSDEALARLIDASGGVLRDLVALVRDAWAYAETETIDEDALDEAIRDRADRFRRLLEAGDLDALRAADATAGHEVPADRKVRLLQHGLLLELGTGPDVTVRVHPLVRRLFAD